VTDASDDDDAPPPATDAADPKPAASRVRGRLGRVGYVAALAAVVMIPLCGRAAFEGRAEVQAADEAQQAGDIDGEIMHLGRAARWRTPILSHDEDARARLFALGEAALAEGESSESVALAAFREVRRALLATRALSVADPEQLQRANEHIAELMAAQEARFGTDVGGTGDPRAWHLDKLQAAPGPTPWRAMSAALCFVGWIVASAGFVLRGLDAAGRLRPRPAVRWGAASLVLLVAWAMLLVSG
jgi:hypothetical protein